MFFKAKLFKEIPNDLSVAHLSTLTQLSQFLIQSSFLPQGFFLSQELLGNFLAVHISALQKGLSFSVPPYLQRTLHIPIIFHAIILFIFLVTFTTMLSSSFTSLLSVLPTQRAYVSTLLLYIHSPTVPVSLQIINNQLNEGTNSFKISEMA